MGRSSKVGKVWLLSIVAYVCLGAMAASAFVAVIGAGAASANSSRIAVISDNTAYGCSTLDEWHFIMTGVTNPNQAARTIRVAFANGTEYNIALDGVSGTTAHYYLAANLTTTVNVVTATVPGRWAGSLRLSAAPHSSCAGSFHYELEPDGHVHAHIHIHNATMEFECEYEHQLGSPPHLNVHLHIGDRYEWQEEYYGYTNDVDACLASIFGSSSSHLLTPCLVGEIGDLATQGRFGYKFSNTVPSFRVTVSSVSGGGTRPFASVDTGTNIPRWSEVYTLGSSPIIWSFSGSDDLGVRHGTTAAPLTATLPVTNSVVTSSNRCPYVPPAGCRQGSLGNAADNNVLVRRTAALAGMKSGGRLSVGGNVTGANWQAGLDLPSQPNRIDAAFNADVTSASGHAPNGSIAVAGRVTGSLQAAGSVRTETTPSIRVDARWADDAAAAWAQAAVTAPVVVSDSSAATKTLRFEGQNAQVNVFSLTATQLATARKTQLRIPNGSMAIINVTGNSFTAAGSNDGTMWDGAAYTAYPSNSTSAIADAYRTHVVWNFATANTVNVSGFTLEGTLLAPKASVSTSGSRINGSMFVDTMASAGTTSAYSSVLRCANLPEGGEYFDNDAPWSTTTTAAPTTTTTVAPTTAAATTTTVAPTTAAATTTTSATVAALVVTTPPTTVAATTTTVAATTTTVAPTTTVTLPAPTTTTTLPIVVLPYSASTINPVCNNEVWHFVATQAGMDPATISAVTASITWSDGLVQTVARVIVDQEAIYQAIARPGLTVTGATMAIPSGMNPTFALIEGGQCPPEAPALEVCYEGAAGSVATEGRFAYRSSATVAAAHMTNNTISAAGFNPPFTEIAVDGYSIVYSVPFRLRSTPMTWSFDGVYDGGGDFPAIDVSLGATGVVVTDNNDCPAGLVTPITHTGVCYAQAVGTTATAGRFWYETDYAIAAADIRTNSVTAGSAPFSSFGVAGRVRTTSDLVTLGSSPTVWQFDGVDALAHRTGVLTATLATTAAHTVAAGEQCSADFIAAVTVAGADTTRPT
jgi:choice-of-anchor A domain-containing protein